MTDSDRENEQERQAPTIRDRRRIDPQTYQVREPQAEPAAPAASAPAAEEAGASAADEAPVSAGGEATEMQDERDAQVADLTRQVAERTDDLQRLQAEYVNYKRRVDRDRETARSVTIGTVLNELLPLLDNIASAREHNELSGGFKAVGEALERFVSGHGVESYGAAGEDFDPQIHEALMQLPDAGDGHPVCAQVFQVGYRIGDRVLRPARVAVGAAPADAESVEPPVEEAEAVDAGVEVAAPSDANADD